VVGIVLTVASTGMAEHLDKAVYGGAILARAIMDPL
jgi:hypothetical protein